MYCLLLTHISYLNTKTMNFTLCVVLCLLTLAEDNFERIDLTDFVHVTVHI